MAPVGKVGRQARVHGHAPGGEHRRQAREQALDEGHDFQAARGVLDLADDPLPLQQRSVLNGNRSLVGQDLQRTEDPVVKRVRQWMLEVDEPEHAGAVG